MPDDERFNNYHLGGFVILIGAVFFACGGRGYSERVRSGIEAGLVGLVFVVLGAWAIFREFRRRRREKH
jgi:hypothetical protein